MPRDIPVGNGKLLVTFDHQYQIRDVYFPHVGQENHAGAGPCRFGVHADVPGKHKSQLYWTSDRAWTIRRIVGARGKGRRACPVTSPSATAGSW